MASDTPTDPETEREPEASPIAVPEVKWGYSIVVLVVARSLEPFDNVFDFTLYVLLRGELCPAAVYLLFLIIALEFAFF